MPRSTTPPLTPTDSAAITDLKVFTYPVRTLLEQTPSQEQSQDTKNQHDNLLKELLSPGHEENDGPEIIVQTGLLDHNKITMLTIPAVVLITPPHLGQSHAAEVKVSANSDKRDKEESKIEIYPYPLKGTPRCTSNFVKRFSSNYLSGLFLDEPRTNKGFSVKLTCPAVSQRDEFMLNDKVRNILNVDYVLGRGCNEILFKREEGDAFREIKLGPQGLNRDENVDGMKEKLAQGDEEGKKAAFHPWTPTDRYEKVRTAEIGKMLIGYRFVRRI
ncbi:hypothetical protein I302_100459 [Kwoniella bestiolae CBS 10118]|uniref:Uncharacterized protein n=1 Tax=Kwoniella bestiolae CBS 10118 TaxID=1296100 RepID=A0A1B9G555_9TREE|nr:hypothetical protein I302_03833 [Kwoniella bestiolae CBS 10118]OCF26155.1 hypothetical protein I302_03833 [Kwoniella bestiolae CBS 10118]